MTEEQQSAHEIIASKRALRHGLRAALREVDPLTRARAADRVASDVADFVAARVAPRGDAVGLFASMAEELDLSLLDAKLRAHSVRRAYPVWREDAFRFVVIDDDTAVSDLPAGAFGIRAPVWSSQREVRPPALGAIVVPGLGFDKQGARIGRGKGYYDRILADVDLDCAVGVAFDAQLVATVPTEPHDVRLRWLFTPAHGVFRVSS